MKGMLYQYFCDIPMWLMATMLYFFVIGILFIIRDWREGLPYNISVASQQGDWALIGIILIGVEIVRRQQNLLAPWLESWNIQIIWLTVSIIFGIIYQWVVIAKSREWGTVADAFHNLFIAPLLVFMLGATLPVIFIYGEYYEKVAAIMFGWVWFLTLIFDASQGRLQQAKWLWEQRGIDLPLHEPPALYSNGRKYMLGARKK